MGPDPGLSVTSHPSNIPYPPFIFTKIFPPLITSIILTSSFGTLVGTDSLVRVTEATTSALAGPPQGPYHPIRLAANGPAPYIYGPFYIYIPIILYYTAPLLAPKAGKSLRSLKGLRRSVPGSAQRGTPPVHTPDWWIHVVVSRSGSPDGGQ